jgi:hypothetical protein
MSLIGGMSLRGDRLTNGIGFVSPISRAGDAMIHKNSITSGLGVVFSVLHSP